MATKTRIKAVQSTKALTFFTRQVQHGISLLSPKICAFPLARSDEARGIAGASAAALREMHRIAGLCCERQCSYAMKRGTDLARTDVSGPRDARSLVVNAEGLGAFRPERAKLMLEDVLTTVGKRCCASGRAKQRQK